MNGHCPARALLSTAALPMTVFLMAAFLMAVATAPPACALEGRAHVPSRAEAMRLPAPAAAAELRTDGFARPGDGGGAAYRRLAPGAAGLGGAAAARARITTADGAVFELAEVEPTPQMFGASGGDADLSAAENLAAFRAAMVFAAAGRRVLRVPAGVYLIAGGLYTHSGLHMRFDDGAWLKPTEYSMHGPAPAGGGAFISNITARADHADSVQSDIVIENAHVDGGLLPKPRTLRVRAVEGEGRVRLAPAAIASDRLFHGPPERLAAGRMATALTGRAIAQTAVIQAAEAASGLLVLPGAFADRLAPGDLLRVGANDNAFGFGRGAHGVRLRGGVVRDFLATWAGGGSGGKAVNFEKGCFDCRVEDMRLERVSWGLFVQGTPGRAPDPPRGNGQPYAVRDILARNLLVRDCEAAAGFYGLTRDSDPDGDRRVMSVRVEGLTAVNCGVAVTRPLTTFREKSGALVFAEAQNVTVRGFALRNAPGQELLGVAGPIGAVFWGWGRNLVVEGAAGADVDQLVRFGRARAMGDDAPPRGQIRQLRGLDVTIRLDGRAGALAAAEPGPFAGHALGAGPDWIMLRRPPTAVSGALAGRMIRIETAEGEQTRMIRAHDGATGRLRLDRPWEGAPPPDVAYRVDGVERLPGDEAEGRLRLSAAALAGPPVDPTLWAYPDLRIDIGDGRARPALDFIE